MGIPISIAGNLTRKGVELSFTSGGIARATFTVVVTKRVKEGDVWKDGPPSYFHCTAWRQIAENLAESVTEGQRVVVIGTMAQREYETKEGEKRSVWDVTVDEVGPSLRFAQASVRKVERQAGGDAFGSYQQAKADLDDVWTNPQQPDESPF